MRLISALLLALLLACPLSCDIGGMVDLQQVNLKELKYGSQYRELARYCRGQAQSGNVRAMTILGVMYLNGSGLHADFQKSFNWLKQAANEGDIQAMHYLSTLYLDGQGTGQDLRLASHWNEKAIMAGNLDAMVLRGICYLEGLMGVIDEDKAIAWFERAATAGSVDGMLLLAGEYEENINYEQEKALYWFERAAGLGSEYAMYALAERYKNSDPLAALAWYEKLTHSQGQYADYAGLSMGAIYFDMGQRDKAVSAYEQAAQRGNSMAKLELGYIYSVSEGDEQTKALYWLTQIGESGQPDDMARQAMLYLDDAYLPVDEQQAIYWLEKAIKAGHSDSLLVLAGIYRARQQNDLALPVYEQAAELGYVAAMEQLADFYQQKEKSCPWYNQAALRGSLTAIERQRLLGCALPEDYPVIELQNNAALGISESIEQLAVYYYELGRAQDYIQAAGLLRRLDQLSPQAMYCLGMMYENGLGVERNTASAYYYMEKAAQDSYEPAQRYLLEISGQN